MLHTATKKYESHQTEREKHHAPRPVKIHMNIQVNGLLHYHINGARVTLHCARQSTLS